MQTTETDRLVDYLRRLERAAAHTQRARRAELVAEIRGHIDTALRQEQAAGEAGRVGPGARVRVHLPGTDGRRKLNRRNRAAPACPANARWVLAAKPPVIELTILGLDQPSCRRSLREHRLVGDPGIQAGVPGGA